jgi:hypothetical protein
MGGRELPLFDMLFIEEELNAWEKDGRDIWGCVTTSERLAIVHGVDSGERGGSGRTTGVRHVNEAVVVKGREYQGNVFGGFRRSAAMAIGAGRQPSLFWSSSQSSPS